MWCGVRKLRSTNTGTNANYDTDTDTSIQKIVFKAWINSIYYIRLTIIVSLTFFLFVKITTTLEYQSSIYYYFPLLYRWWKFENINQLNVMTCVDVWHWHVSNTVHVFQHKCRCYRGEKWYELCFFLICLIFRYSDVCFLCIWCGLLS